MSNQFTIIEEKNWKRAQHCAIFRECVEPAFCVSFELDITRFYEKVKQQHLSLTMALIYTVSMCANEIEAFRYRFLDGKVVLFDRIDTAFTYFEQDSELFKVVCVPLLDNMEAYVNLAGKLAKEQKEYFTGPLGNDVFQFSPLPWISFTHISHTISGKKEQATPLFDWGKFFKRDDKLLLPFSVQVHHSFVDGLHVGRLAQSLQVLLDKE